MKDRVQEFAAILRYQAGPLLASHAADAADQAGARIALRHSLGGLPQRYRLDGEVTLGLETGDYRFVSREALLRALAPLPLSLSFGVEAAAGTIDGDLPPAQALWRLGGNSTVRGYPAATLVADTYWRACAELGIARGPVTYTVFADAARNGQSGTFSQADTKRSLGFGVTQFGGVLRVDIAHGLDSGGGWRLHAQFNRAFDR
jgi:hemolysin activation/secretion protein